MTKLLRVFIGLIGLVVLHDASIVFAQCELGQLFGSDTALGDHFAEAVAIDGDFLVIGAHADDDMGSFSGSAYVFVRQGLEWIEQAKLVADDGALFDAFGLAVTISGDRVAVGALADDDDGGGSGSVYVFAREGETWVQQAKLTASDASAGDAFGVSVSLDGDLLVVGAHRVDDAGEDSGAAYVFRRIDSTWTQEAKLIAADADESDFFGEAVAISGDTVIVGAARDDSAAKNAGAAYVFVREDMQWVQQAKLVASDLASSDHFGFSVAVSGDSALIGANNADAAGGNSGAAYAFRRDGATWTEEAKLLPADLGGGDEFGFSVALDGDDAVIGSSRDGDAAPSAGSAYVFSRSGAVWTESAKLVDANAGDGDRFGIAVGVSGGTILVGSAFDDDIGDNAGSAFVFSAGNGVDSDCNENGVPDQCDIAGGNSTDCNGNNLPDECEPDCNDNGIADACDIADGDSDDCNENAVPDECEPDCNENGITDECDIDGGASNDCNGNNVPDECDTGGGDSDDCNENAVPDECEPDCNENGIADECDIEFGVSQDCNVNGIPDECDGGCPPPPPPPDVDPECDELDEDGDAVNDCDDACPDTPETEEADETGCSCSQRDTDEDGVADCDDHCAGEPDIDEDGDGTVDCQDGCPLDPNKIAPGACGCGSTDVDEDADGTPDCQDACRLDPEKTDPGQCGCGSPETDSDGDGSADCIDGCPDDAAKSEPGQCGCNAPDTDTDEDRVADCNDACPGDPAKIDAGFCGCGIPEDDRDNDETPDCADGCPEDSAKTSPGACGCGIADDDTDGDGAPDCNDACPADVGKIEPGVCGCGVPDVDADQDSVADCADDCLDTEVGAAVDEFGCAIATDVGLSVPDEEVASSGPSPGLCGVCGQGGFGASAMILVSMLMFRPMRRRRRASKSARGHRRTTITPGRYR